MIIIHGYRATTLVLYVLLNVLVRTGKYNHLPEFPAMGFCFSAACLRTLRSLSKLSGFWSCVKQIQLRALFASDASFCFTYLTFFHIHTYTHTHMSIYLPTHMHIYIFIYFPMKIYSINIMYFYKIYSIYYIFILNIELIKKNDNHVCVTLITRIIIIIFYKINDKLFDNYIN